MHRNRAARAQQPGGFLIAEGQSRYDGQSVKIRRSAFSARRVCTQWFVCPVAMPGGTPTVRRRSLRHFRLDQRLIEARATDGCGPHGRRRDRVWRLEQGVPEPWVRPSRRDRCVQLTRPRAAPELAHQVRGSAEMSVTLSREDSERTQPAISAARPECTAYGAFNRNLVSSSSVEGGLSGSSRLASTGIARGNPFSEDGRRWRWIAAVAARW